MPYPNRIQNSITFELSLTEMSVIRTVYTYLDLLKDVGGLFGALAPLCTMFVTICQFEGSFQLVMADMLIDRDSQKKEKENESKL